MYLYTKHGCPLREAIYAEVIAACALAPDIAHARYRGGWCMQRKMSRCIHAPRTQSTNACICVTELIVSRISHG